MSNITLQVSYGHLTKKITCLKTQTVNQATGMAMDKFLLNQSELEGKLLYQRKVLDTSLPLRFTNVINNSKVELQVKEVSNKTVSASAGGSKVDIKLIVAGVPTARPQYLLKDIDTSLLLSQVVQEFEKANSGLKLPLTESQTNNIKIEMILVDQKIPLSQFNSTVLGTVIGSGVKNFVVRLNYYNNEGAAERELHQQQIVRTQLEQQRQANVKRMEEEHLHREQLKEELKRQKLLERQREEAQEKENRMELDPNVLPVDKNTIHNESRIVRRNSGSEQEQSASVNASENESAINTRLIDDALQLNIESDTQLYKPGNHPTTLYENPDDDYEMTVSQAKQYYKMVQQKGNAKPAKIPKPVTHYSIRLRFPDRNIIQFNYEQKELSNLKLGTLLKRIDQILLPEYVNHYIIKFPEPPFKVLSFTFDTNNKLLLEFPEFQTERILLLWELKDTSLSRKGPFVKEESIATIKNSNERAEIVIEENRSLLPDDEVDDNNKKKTTTNSFESNSSSTFNSTKNPKDENVNDRVPRWMKLNRK